MVSQLGADILPVHIWSHDVIELEYTRIER